jgi:hypothetical protein
VERYTHVLGDLLRDPERRRAMGGAARARISAHFTLDRMGDRMDALLQRATELATSNPRRIPSAAEAREAALAGVRVVQLTAPARASWLAARSPRLHTALFRTLNRVGMPLYRLGMRMGLHWLEPLKDRVFRALFPGAK